MQLCPVKVADTLGGLLCGRHGDKAIAASPGALGVGHHLSSNNLQEVRRNIEEDEQEQRDAEGTSPQCKFLFMITAFGLALPYLLKRVFRSVALVVEERPLTHRFLLLLAAAPLPAATHKYMTTYII